jgi:hypothetical protein
MELSPNHNWTVSFAGARLATGNIDIIYLGGGDDETNDGNKQNASLAVCYLDNNSIGIGSCIMEDNNDNDDPDENNEGDKEEESNSETLVVPLLYTTRDFHVLTITYNAQDHRVQIYQDTHLAADLDIVKVSLPSSISKIGPPHSNDSLSPVASNIALRHVSYFDRHVQEASVVEIADLILHMSL